VSLIDVKEPYIAGPMTGYPDHNIPAFFAAEERLRALGYKPNNPARNNGPTATEAIEDARNSGLSWSDYMRLDIRRLALCDSICVLPGWQNSKGANLEVDIAERLGIPVVCLTNDGLVPRVRVIGLSGYARAGKDTVANFLAAHGYERASFADNVREALYRLDPALGADYGGMTVQEVVHSIGWERAKGEYPEIRAYLQRFGSDVGRDIIDPDLWVKLAFRKLPDGSKAVFSDVRFANEAEAIRARGGRIYRIERPGYGPVNGHGSETALDSYPFDGTILNTTTLADLALVTTQRVILAA